MTAGERDAIHEHPFFILNMANKRNLKNLPDFPKQGRKAYVHKNSYFYD